MTDIFSDENKVSGNWVKFTTVGDTVQGTYISKREAMNNLSGKMQEIYEIKDAEGEIWNVGGKPGIDMQMRHIKFGQIIGMKYVEERKSTKPGMNASKIIQVFAPKGQVDQAWLQEQEGSNTAGLQPLPEASQTLTEAELLEKIAAIVKTKFGLEEPDAVKTKVMEETGLAFINSNLGKILEALSK